MPKKTTKEILDATYKELIQRLEEEKNQLHNSVERIATRDTDLAEKIESQEDLIYYKIKRLEYYIINDPGDKIRIVMLNQTIDELNIIHETLKLAVPETEKISEPWYIEWQKAIADFFRIFSACDKELENRKEAVRISAKSLKSLGEAAHENSGKAEVIKSEAEVIKSETEKLIKAGFEAFTTGEYDPYVILSDALGQEVTANTDIAALWKQIGPIVAGSNEELLEEVGDMLDAIEAMDAEIQREERGVQMDKVHAATDQALAGPERRKRIQSAFEMLSKGPLKRSYDKLHESQVKLDKIERSLSHDDDSPSLKI